MEVIEKVAQETNRFRDRADAPAGIRADFRVITTPLGSLARNRAAMAAAFCRDGP